jgi:hypothetical protein
MACRRDAKRMKHVVLLGDSVFDNGAYVGSSPALVHQLHQLLPGGWAADLNARDGAVIGEIRHQLEQLPPGATHLAISVGGNDALMQTGVLDQKISSVAGALNMLDEIRKNFRIAYATMLDAALSLGLPSAVCTIYEPRYPDPSQRRIAAAALTLLNDAIVQEAFMRKVTLVDLRLICNQEADFANPIEPSSQGGTKIARAILRFMKDMTDADVIVK